MSHHRYPRSSLLADYARAAIGIVVVGIPLVLAGLSGIAAVLVIALWGLFVAYGIRTVVRHLTTVDVSEIGIRTLGPLPRAIPWADLRDVQLRYYSTRRDRRDGWMQLKVAGEGRSIGIDSSLEGFDGVLEQVAAEARRQHLELNEATAENLQQRGVGAEVKT